MARKSHEKLEISLMSNFVKISNFAVLLAFQES